MQRRYHHRQFSWLTALASLFIVVGLIVAWYRGEVIGDLASPMPPIWVWFTLSLVVIVPWCFSSLTIAIEGGELRWHFGPGVWRKRLALSEIASMEVTRTRFYEGWGIRWTRRGWLYNVAGLDAVIVHRKDGKAILLGSDEPQRLVAALRRTLGA